MQTVGKTINMDRNDNVSNGTHVFDLYCYREHSMTPLCWSKSHLRRRPIGGLCERTSQTQETPTGLCPLVEEYIPEGPKVALA